MYFWHSLAYLNASADDCVTFPIPPAVPSFRGSEKKNRKKLLEWYSD